MCCDSKGCCGKGCKCIVSKVSHILLLIGGINWGLIGLGMLLGSMSSWNVVGMVFGPMLESLIYVLVGVAAVVTIFGCKCKKCNSGMCSVEGAKAEGKSDSAMPGQM